ncbi:MAG TPA: PspC domain-containing protein [Candidatus Acidoferrum sp.]|jgi:phage shock protein PspC (stress-responsive transcriptional regulator)|nr:PspC domain-containing protein [Candidatus Acidoferrum sp.]
MQAPGSQTFFRGTDRILGGVSSGLAEGFHVEVLWVRVAFVVLAFINGVGLLLYVVLWVLMPERAGYRPPGQNAFGSMGADIKRAWADLKNQFGSGPATPTTPASTATAAPSAPGQSAPVATEEAASPPAAPQPVTHTPTFIFGAILIGLGLVFLAANSGITWNVILPAALIALGIVLLLRNLEKKT